MDVQPGTPERAVATAASKRCVVAEAGGVCQRGGGGSPGVPDVDPAGEGTCTASRTRQAVWHVGGKKAKNHMDYFF